MADYNAYNTDWAAAVQAGANILGSAAQMIYQGEADSENRYLYRQTRDMQRQWALEDYEKVLRDSSPSEQVRRLKEAGLNPNLVYGSGNIQTGVTSAPTMNMPTPPYKQRGLDLDLSVVNALGNILDLQLKRAQVKKIQNEAENVQEDTKLKELQQRNQDLVNQAQFNYNDVYESTMDALKEAPYLQNKLTSANVDNVAATTSLVKAKLRLTDEQCKLLSKQMMEIDAKIELISEQTNLTKEQVITEMFKQDDLAASAYMKRRIGSIQSDMASMYRSMAYLNNTNADWLSDNADYRHMQLVNDISESASRIEMNYESAKQTQAETEQTKVNTGVRIFDALMRTGDIALDILTYRAMGRNATRGRKSTTTTTHYDKKGNVTSSTKTDFNSN